MSRKCPVTIGDKEFATKLLAKAAVKDVLNGHPLGYSLTGTEDLFIRDLIALHPADEDKIGCGIHHIEIRKDPTYGTTRCFYIVRVDGSITDVGYLKCIDGEQRRHLVRPALRQAILPQILAFKQEQFAQYDAPRCEYTGDVLKAETCHIDHRPPMTFETLVTLWLKQVDLSEADIHITERSDNASSRFMTDRWQAESWIAFHRTHATLRMLSRRGNLSHSKREAGGSLLTRPDEED